jgi:Glycosyl transferase family 2
MAVHNDARFVGAAIDSVLAQTYQDFELVIVLDHSTDGSTEIVRSYGDPRIRVLVNDTHLGLTRTLNRGLAAIESEYVARLDADDIAYPERLEKQVAWLDAHPDVAILGVQAMPIDDNGRRLRRIEWWSFQWQRPASGPGMEWFRMFDTPFVHTGVMFRRAVICGEFGGYDERYTLAQDAELWMRVSRKYRVENLAERLVAMRVHASSVSGSRERWEWDGHAERKTAITQALMRDVLRGDVPREWAHAWVSVNTSNGTTVHEVRDFLGVLDQIAARFAAIHPDACGNGVVARHQASLLVRAMAKVITRDRRLALLIFRKLAARHRGTALRVFPRMLLLFVIGKRAAQLFHPRK